MSTFFVAFVSSIWLHWLKLLIGYKQNTSKEKLGFRFDWKMANIELVLIVGFKLLNVTECVNFKSPYYISIRKLDFGIERLFF
jgi:hypothetical protein